MRIQRSPDASRGIFSASLVGTGAILSCARADVAVAGKLTAISTFAAIADSIIALPPSHSRQYADWKVGALRRRDLPRLLAWQIILIVAKAGRSATRRAAGEHNESSGPTIAAFWVLRNSQRIVEGQPLHHQSSGLTKHRFAVRPTTDFFDQPAEEHCRCFKLLWASAGRSIGGRLSNDLGHIRPPFSGTTGLASRCMVGSWDLQPVRTTHLPSLQDNVSCAGGTLFGFSQWEGD